MCSIAWATTLGFADSSARRSAERAARRAVISRSAMMLRTMTERCRLRSSRLAAAASGAYAGFSAKPALSTRAGPAVAEALTEASITWVIGAA